MVSHIIKQPLFDWDYRLIEKVDNSNNRLFYKSTYFYYF